MSKSGELYLEPEEKTDEELAKAEARLKEFEEATADTHRMARLRKENSGHPLLVGLSLVGVGSVLLGVGGVISMIVIYASPDLQRTLAQMPLVNVAPLAAVGMALVGVVVWGILYGLAVTRGGSSPRLPKDLAQLNRLRSDVQRLRAAKKVARRLSETPAPTRRTEFPGSR